MLWHPVFYICYLSFLCVAFFVTCMSVQKKIDTSEVAILMMMMMSGSVIELSLFCLISCFMNTIHVMLVYFGISSTSEERVKSIIVIIINIIVSLLLVITLLY